MAVLSYCHAALQIFLLDMQGSLRGQASGEQWLEDMQWSHRLDAGWNLSAVKQVRLFCPYEHSLKSSDVCPQHMYQLLCESDTVWLSRVSHTVPIICK